jgi:hypothetical protein
VIVQVVTMLELLSRSTIRSAAGTSTSTSWSRCRDFVACRTSAPGCPRPGAGLDPVVAVLLGEDLRAHRVVVRQCFPHPVRRGRDRARGPRGHLCHLPILPPRPTGRPGASADRRGLAAVGVTAYQVPPAPWPSVMPGAVSPLNGRPPSRRW